MNYKQIFKSNHKRITILILLLLLIFILYPIIKPNELNKNKHLKIGGPKVETKGNTKNKKRQINSNTSSSNSIVYFKSEKENVKKAYKDNKWKIHKTKQIGAHTIDFSDSSLDREEISTTISQAINNRENNIEFWWLDAINQNKIISTIQIIDNETYFNVYLDWISEQGWKVELVEELYELP